MPWRHAHEIPNRHEPPTSHPDRQTFTSRLSGRAPCPLGEALRERTEALRARLAHALDDRLAPYTTDERAVVTRFLGDLHGFVTTTLSLLFNLRRRGSGGVVRG